MYALHECRPSFVLVAVAKHLDDLDNAYVVVFVSFFPKCGGFPIPVVARMLYGGRRTAADCDVPQ